MSEDPAYDPGQTWWDRMWGTIGSWWRSIPAWEKALAGTILVIASIGIAVATGGASIGPEAQLLGGVSALAAAAKVALIEVSIGIGFAVAGWAISSAISGNWDTNALNDAVADAIFFAGVFLFISTSVSAIKYAYRADPYPMAEAYPPNNGAVPGTEEMITLEPGVYGRYGGVGPKSRYITNYGASPEQLSLPPSNNRIFTEIHVLKPIKHVQKAIVAPWAPWGGIGGGQQYYLPKTIEKLIKGGFIRLG